MKTVTVRAVFIAAVLFLIGAPSVVTAHSEFQSGTPKDGATVGTGPIDIVGTFSEALASRSHMELLDSTGAVVARAAIDGNQMRIGVEGLQPGTFEVRWTSVAKDGDILRSKPGDWTFTVAAAASTSPSVQPSSSSPASLAPSAAPSASLAPSAWPAPTNTSSTSGGDVLLPILAAVIVVAILGGYLLRRRSAVGP
jgi:methionine-rich copper-binding protein CopC